MPSLLAHHLFWMHRTSSHSTDWHSLTISHSFFTQFSDFCVFFSICLIPQFIAPKDLKNDEFGKDYQLIGDLVVMNTWNVILSYIWGSFGYINRDMGYIGNTYWYWVSHNYSFVSIKLYTLLMVFSVVYLNSIVLCF